MNRLVINSGTPQAWEIQLKPGTNSLGRNDANDFQINDASVSGSHCHILVGDDAVVLRDLGSTNGTFVGGARIQEHNLEHGKGIRLGSVDLIFYSADAPPAAVESAPAQPAVRMALRVTATPLAVPIPPPVSAVLQPTPGTAGMTGIVRPPPPKGFYAKLPGAFLYPFKGAGLLILFCATLAFSAMNFLSAGLIGLVIRAALYGFVFLFMQNIILTTTSNEKDELCFPEASGLFGAAFQLAGTVLASFWLALGLALARFNDVSIPAEAILASVILGGVYFPMALLVVAMKDTVLAANPLVVIPAMLKAPLKYSVTVVLLLGVFGIRQLGNLISGGAGTLALRTHDQNTFLLAVAFKSIWALLSVYLLTVTMRILGLFYNASHRLLGWFN